MSVDASRFHGLKLWRVFLEQIQREQVAERRHVDLLARRVTRAGAVEAQPLEHRGAVVLVAVLAPALFKLQAVELVNAQALKRPLDQRTLIDPSEAHRHVIRVDVVAAEDDEEDHDRRAHRHRRLRARRDAAHRQPDRAGREGLEHDEPGELGEPVRFRIQSSHRVHHRAERQGEKGTNR